MAADPVITRVQKPLIARRAALKRKLFFWHDAAGHEIDIVIERGAEIARGIEAKDRRPFRRSSTKT